MRLIAILFIITASIPAKSQSIAGKWSTIDDHTGEIKSIVQITEKGGKFYGTVVRIYPGPADDPDPVCDKCPTDDQRYNKKIIGMEIIKDMIFSGGAYSAGHILDPENGKIYRCKLWVEGIDLKVRGYWGPFYRTQTWKKVQ
jgi:uncharacterized protein (DUF2147 family)